jgi:hypothetical protein
MSSKASVEAVSELRKAVWRLSGSGMSYNKFWLVYGDKLDSLTKTTVKRTEALSLGHPIQGEAKPIAAKPEIGEFYTDSGEPDRVLRLVSHDGAMGDFQISKGGRACMRIGLARITRVEPPDDAKEWQVPFSPQPPTPAGVREIIEAVAHIGVDFGFGPYELEDKFIEQARALAAAMEAGE